jgi:hypothetical protein
VGVGNAIDFLDPKDVVPGGIEAPGWRSQRKEERLDEKEA